MLCDNKLRRLNTDPCLPMLSEGEANLSDLPNTNITGHTWKQIEIKAHDRRRWKTVVN